VENILTKNNEKGVLERRRVSIKLNSPMDYSNTLYLFVSLVTFYLRDKYCAI
jgi:hypothetical protein